MALIFQSWYLDFAALIGVLFYFVYWFFTSTFDTFAKRGVPYLKPTPLFGNIREFLLMQKSINEVHLELYNKLKHYKYAGIFQIRTPSLMLIDPDVIKQFLVKDFQYFQDRGVYIPKRQVLGQHLFSLGGSRWRVLRTKLTPTFTSGKMKMMYAAIAESSRRLQEYVAPLAAEKSIVELKEVLARFSTDIIANCAFGLEVNTIAQPDSQFRRMGRMFFEPSIRKQLIRAANFFFPDIAPLLDADDIENEVTDFFMTLVRDTVNYRVKNNETRNDFLQLMINLKVKGRVDETEENPNGAVIGDTKRKGDENFELDDGLFAAQVFVFFLAGFETSSTTMSFAFHELAVNPDIQARLREEIDETLQNCGGSLTYDAIMNMKYMDKVVSETLRKYPPVPSLFRECTIPYKLPDSGVQMEKGERIVIPVYALHHDPNYFPEPERFDPERFSEENKAKRPHYVYLPFGEGPRNCIGMRFGLLQTKMGIASLLSRFEFQLCERTELPIKIDPKQLVTASYTGTILRVTNRKDIPMST